MAGSWFVSVVVAAVLTSTASGNQNDVLAALLSRMDAVEGKVASLSNEVASLDSRLTKLDGQKEEPEPTEFKLVNVKRTVDRAASRANFTVLYQAPEKPQVLMAFNEWTSPIEVAHEPGTVHFSVPDSEVSPVLYVRTTSNLIYTLILLGRDHGPPREVPEDIPNVILTTSPERFVKFQEENQEQEITVTSHLTGTRRVTEETLLYYGYVLNDYIVDFFPPSSLYADNLRPYSSAESDDVNAAVSADVKRLRLVEHDREGRETSDTVKLDASHENSGVLFVQKRFELFCQSCVLYELRVTKPLPYFLDDERYSLPEGALVAYKDLYNFGPDFQGPRYFRFVRYNQSEEAHSFHKTCQRGRPCQLICEVFGDNPSAYFNLFGASTRNRPAYFDQSGARLVQDARESAKVKGWSAKTGFLAFSVIEFDDVKAEHAGNYVCFADIDSGLMLRRVYALTVV